MLHCRWASARASKCNSAVWKAMRNIHDTEHVEWMHMKNGNLERCWNYVQV